MKTRWTVHTGRWRHYPVSVFGCCGVSLHQVACSWCCRPHRRCATTVTSQAARHWSPWWMVRHRATVVACRCGRRRIYSGRQRHCTRLRTRHWHRWRRDFWTAQHPRVGDVSKLGRSFENLQQIDDNSAYSSAVNSNGEDVDVSKTQKHETGGQ